MDSNQSLDQLIQKNDEFYQTCRNLIILNHNAYSLKVKIQDENEDKDIPKFTPNEPKKKKSHLHKEKKLVETMRDTIYQYACLQAEELQQLHEEVVCRQGI